MFHEKEKLRWKISWDCPFKAEKAASCPYLREVLRRWQRSLTLSSRRSGSRSRGSTRGPLTVPSSASRSCTVSTTRHSASRRTGQDQLCLWLFKLFQCSYVKQLSIVWSNSNNLRFAEFRTCCPIMIQIVYSKDLRKLWLTSGIVLYRILVKKWKSPFPKMAFESIWQYVNIYFSCTIFVFISSHLTFISIF